MISGEDYKIDIPTSSSEFSFEDIKFQIPKNNSGYGPKEITMTVQSVDGNAVNIGGTTTHAFEILSLDPAIPHVGIADNLKFDEYLSSTINASGIDLSDVVRVPNINESHILELIGLPAGTIVKVGNVTKTPIDLHSHQVGSKLTGVQLSASEINSAKLLLPQGIIDGSNALDFKARVGAADGIISETGQNRYTYTRMVEFNSKGNASIETVSEDNDLVWSSSGNKDTKSGDDVVFIKEAGSGDLKGGSGNDAAVFSEVKAGKNVIIDLNKTEYIIRDASGSVESSSSIIRQIEGFETIVGSSGDDTIIGSENNLSNLTLKGGIGDDYIVGGSGDDIILGGVGNDFLAGSGGNNQFIIEADNSHDQILDFSSTDKIIFTGFNLVKNGDNLPPEVTVERSDGNNSDWKVSISAINTASTIINSIILENSSSQFSSAGEVLSFLSPRVEFNEKIDLIGLNPFITEFNLDVPVLDILKDTSAERDTYFGVDLNFDDLSSTLGVLADAKFNEALAISDTLSGFDSVTGFQSGLNSASYKGISGSSGDDTIIAKDEDSVLYGGDGGADRLIGGTWRRYSNSKWLC